jgi:hypothetical protein
LVALAITGRPLQPSKKIWAAEDQALWIGVKMCLKQTQPQSFTCILDLPPPQLKEVIEGFPEHQPGLGSCAKIQPRRIAL